MKHAISGRALWRPALVLLTLVGILIFVKVAFLVPRDAETLLGIPLPGTTSDVQVEIDSTFLGEYDGYIRFEIASEDVILLLSDVAFQPRPSSTDPMTVFQGATLGRKAIALYSPRQRPAWWQPEHGHPFLLAYRSHPGPGKTYTGPDAAWYMVDINNASRAIVYVFVLEV